MDEGHWAPAPNASFARRTDARRSRTHSHVYGGRAPAVCDPRTGVVRRHHLYDQTFQRAFKRAVTRSGIAKRATPHTLRRSFATALLQGGYDIRTVQELLGHPDVSTKMIYTHVLKVGGAGVRSPIDVLLQVGMG